MREISPEELSKILKEHKRWCDTDEKEGEKAYLHKADLSNANLSEANLSSAILFQAGLSDARLSGARLSRANLSYAELIGANLRGADLSEVLGLNIEQLGVMLTLYGAKLSLECRKQVKDEYPGLLEELVEEEEEEEE